MRSNKVNVGKLSQSDKVLSKTGLSESEIAGAISNVNINYILQNRRTPNSKYDADPSIVTIALGGVDASLTNEIRYSENPEKFFHSLAIEEVLNGIQARLYTTSVISGGNVEAEKSQVLPKWVFYTDAKNVLLNLRRNTQFTLQVDDIYYSKSTLTAPDDGSNDSYQLLEFADKRTRKITVNLSSGAGGFGGCFVLPTDSVWSSGSGMKAVLVGDSFSTGTAPNIGGLSYSTIVMDRLGIDNYMISGDGGTGFVNNQSGTKYNYVERVGDVLSTNADIILVSATVNDNSNVSELPSAISNWYSAVRASLPSAPIIAIGAQGRSDSATVLMEESFIGAFNSLGDDKIITVPVASGDVPQIFGTGDEGDLKNDGNADIYISSDGTHYNDIGHIFSGESTGQRIIDAISEARR